VTYLDRINVGIAALQMNEDLGFTSSMYALGAGLFFIGYFIFEVPNNLILHKVGARRWIARIMITWGVVSAATAFVWDEKGFAFIRFLLGVFEAGFFPGIILYLTFWFPERQRGKIFGLFMMAGPICNVLGSPISSLLLNVDGFGLRGWQWLFIIEGIPSSILGVVVLFYLTDKPAQATWLAPEERDWLTNEMAKERSRASEHSLASFGAAVKDKRVYTFGMAYVGMLIGVYGIILWLPQIVKGFGVSNSAVGFIAAIPFAVAIFVQLYWTGHSDRSGERIWHTACACFLGGAGLALSAYWADHSVLALAALTAAAMGVFSAQANFWTLPTSFMAGSGAATGIAMINSIGNLGGFFGPYAVGYIKDASGSFGYGMLVLAVAAMIAGFIILIAGPRRPLVGSRPITSS
jgi:ACS family tartrate transporter-like MFS transporter